MKLTNLDVIETNALLEKFMVLKELPPFNFLFGEVGYETTNFILELGPLFFLIIGCFFFFLAKVLLVCLIKKRGDNCLTRRIRKQIHYQAFIIRFLLEGCIVLGLIAMICVLRVSNKSHLTLLLCYR